MRLLTFLILFMFFVKVSSQQISKEELIFLSPEWNGERFEDGRPKVPDEIIKRMKKASRIMVTAYNKSGSQTIDHYSLMGFTKAYNSAKKNCT